jgi:tetratricopeptide (TPR) repeat protein
MKSKVTALLLCLMLSSVSLHAQQTPAIIADSLVKAGWVLLEQQNRPADAAYNFRQAIATDTNCAKAWSGLGSWYRYSGLPDSAVICFRRTLRIDSLYFNAWLNMGRCYAMMGRKEDALAANRVYEKRYPDSTEWIRGYVYIYQDFQQYDSALMYSNLLVEREPGFVSRMMRADLLMQLDNPAAAISDLRPGIKLQPFNPLILTALAKAFLMMGEYDSCELHLSLALSQSPGDPYSLFLLASLKFTQGNLSEALEIADRGFLADSISNAFPGLKAEIFMKMKQFNQAVTEYEKMLRRSPGAMSIVADLCKARSLMNADPAEVDYDSSGTPRFLNFTSLKTKDLDKLVTSRKSRYNFRQLTSRFEKDPRGLGLDDWFMLYYGTAFQSGYTPYGGGAIVDDILNSLRESGDDRELLNKGPGLLKDDFTRFRLYFPIINRYIEAGEFGKAQIIAYNFYGLTSAILATGDGKSPETARIVVAVPDEYLVMSLLGYETSLQSLNENHGHMFDSFEGKYQDGSSATLWFNIDKPFHTLSRSFGR